MISVNGIEYIKSMCEIQADLIPGGILYAIVDEDVISWRKTSAEFNYGILQIGDKLNENSIAVKAMREKKTLIQNVPRSLYGVRLKVVQEPIVDDEGKVVGTFGTAIPLMHPIVKAFNNFAPMLSEMFADGVVLYATDLNKVVSVQNSKKFHIDGFNAGDNLWEGVTPTKVMSSKKFISVENDASVYGVSALEVCYPLFNEDTNEIVGTFGMVIPKAAAASLKEMSKNLEDSLTEIASTIEELAASASNIHVNEQNLNNSINEITNFSQEINEISSFIKEIADETKMLGLNAAIEAARAGDAGRGFGVVAEEIRKLSEQSKSTVPKIQKLTDKIILKVKESSDRSESSLALSQEQAAATEEITSSIEEITSMAEKLSEIALEL